VFTTTFRSLFCVSTLLLASFALTASGQDSPPITHPSDVAEGGVLQSPEWLAMQRDFQSWLAVQQIYSTEEMTAIVNDLNQRALSMSESERKELLADMQERLKVLMSPQANEARQWVSQFRATAANADERLQGKRPDVMSMSAQEIRDELGNFDRDRRREAQAQAAFERTRSLQATNAQSIHTQQQQSMQQFTDARSRAATTQVRSPFAPRPQDLPNYTDFDAVGDSMRIAPLHSLSPWGAPVRWHPMYGYWW
jgi:hypothetical protein